MRGFAIIELMNDLADVPVKYKLLRNAPGFIMDWYITKFNPFTTENVELLGEQGLIVRMPVTDMLRRERPELFRALALRTLNSLRDYGIVIALPPCADFPNAMPLAYGRDVFPFFIMQAIYKGLDILGLSSKTAEVLIIDGDPGLCHCFLDIIYPHINYLTLISDSPDAFLDKTRDIYSDCGLNVQLADFNRSALMSADIIINTRAGLSFAHYFRRGALCFELGDQAALLQLKRSDMLVADGLLLSNGSSFIDLFRFECALFVKSPAFASLKRFYNRQAVAASAARIAQSGFFVASLCLLGKRIRR